MKDCKATVGQLCCSNATTLMLFYSQFEVCGCLQYQFNNRILASASARRPVSNCEIATCMPLADMSTSAAVGVAQQHICDSSQELELRGYV